MKRIISSQQIYFLFFFLFLTVQIVAVKNVFSQSNVVPALREWKASEGFLSLKEKLNVVIDKNHSAELKEAAELFILDLKSMSNLKPSLKEADKPRSGDIFFTINAKDNLKSEGYSLEVGEVVSINASDKAGVFYGSQTLLQILKQSGNKIEKGEGIDYPNYGTRSIMLDVGRKFYQMEYLEKTIRQLAWYKMNVLHLHFTEWSAFRLKSDKYPGLAAKEAYSKADIRRLQDVAKKYHVMIVPEIDLPAHATAISEYNPMLGFKCESMRKARWQGEEANNAGKAWTLDITRPEVRIWIKDLLDEFIPLFDGPYFHIGGDEYQYDPEKILCPELMEAMKARGYTQPGDIFIEWLNEVNEQVKSHGKKTQIWNWWSFGKNKTSIHPAKDIVINVWNKPNQEEIIKDGYSVIITPEEELYVSPGLVDASGYGVVNCKKVYEEWKPEEGVNVMGFKICIWSDRAEHHSDEWFEGHAFEPKVVLAEKVWAGSKSANISAFLKRVDQVGSAPTVGK